MAQMHAVKLSEEFNSEYVKLQKKAEKGNGEARELLSLTDKGIAKLAINPASGKKIPHKLWPKYYVAKYGVTNLWKLNLSGCWRLIYTVIGSEAELVSIVLETMDHKKYERRFGYRN